MCYVLYVLYIDITPEICVPFSIRCSLRFSLKFLRRQIKFLLCVWNIRVTDLPGCTADRYSSLPHGRRRLPVCNRNCVHRTLHQPVARQDHWNQQRSRDVTSCCTVSSHNSQTGRFLSFRWCTSLLQTTKRFTDRTTTKVPKWLW